ncbi:MAG: helix-turn-helix transcriptional regulator [Actinomycetota bacterium]|nr:helix-turn-helix transcriptional regulator [Actinomycetota bacterium]
MGEQSVVDKFSVSLGQKLRAARRHRGWSLGEVEINTEGEFKASVVGAYERGERAISVQRFVALSEIYGVLPADLLPVAVGAEGLVIDLDDLADETTSDFLDRYLATIQLLRKEPGNSEIRRSDQAVLGHLVQTVETKSGTERPV